MPQRVIQCIDNWAFISSLFLLDLFVMTLYEIMGANGGGRPTTTVLMVLHTFCCLAVGNVLAWRTPLLATMVVLFKAKATFSIGLALPQNLRGIFSPFFPHYEQLAKVSGPVCWLPFHVCSGESS